MLEQIFQYFCKKMHMISSGQFASNFQGEKSCEEGAIDERWCTVFNLLLKQQTSYAKLSFKTSYVHIGLLYVLVSCNKFLS